MQAESTALMRLAGLVVAVLAVCTLCFLYLFQTPTPRQLGMLARLKAIGAFYHGGSDVPEPGQTVLVLGDSMALAGFDADAFDQVATERGLQAFNLGVTGKSQIELFFDESETLLAGRHVVLFLTPGLFDSRSLKLQQRKRDCYRLLGFSIEQPVIGRLSPGIVPAENASTWNQHRWRYIWRTNWRILESLRWFIREHSIFQDERRLARNWLGVSATNLKHATWEGHATTAQNAAILSSLELHEPVLFCGDESATAMQRQCLALNLELLQERCASVTVVVPPLHPQLRAALNPSLSRQFALSCPSAAMRGIHFLDLSNMLPEGSFRDLMHVSNEAAADVAQTIYEVVFAQSGASR